MHDKEALQVIYEDLVEQHNALKEEHVSSESRMPLKAAQRLIPRLSVRE